jgi:hypothetical protein
MLDVYASHLSSMICVWFVADPGDFICKGGVEEAGHMQALG